MKHLIKSPPASCRMIVLVFICLITGISGWAQPALSGSETQINTTTSNSQQNPAIAMDSSGNYVVVWESFNQDGSDYGIYFQLFTNTGVPTGVETQVNTTTSGAQRFPDVAMDQNGNFVVVWMSDGQDSDGWGIYKRAFGNTGTALSGEARVNSTTANDQKRPGIAMTPGGDYVIVFESDQTDGSEMGVYARNYNSSHTALSASYLVNTTTSGFQGYPDVAVDDNGNFVVVWQSNGQDGSGNGIYAQLYDNTLALVGSEFLCNSNTNRNQQEPAVAMNSSGEFLVVWSSYNYDGDHYGIYGQRFDASGNSQGSQTLINTSTSGSQDHAAVAVSREGSFLISWTSWGTDGDRAGVYGKAYQSDLTVLGSEFLVNTRTTDFQQFPAIGFYSEDLNARIAWQDGLRISTATNDGDDYGVFSQGYSVKDTTAPNAVCQNITVYLDGTGNATITANDVDGGSTDNVGIDSYAINTSSFTCSNIGSNTVILTVTDARGNSDNCTAIVTIADSTSPAAVCGPVTVYLDGSGNATISGGDLDAGSSDNCSISTYAASTSNFSCSNLGSNTVTLTVTDASANTGTCNSVVTVVDSTSPAAVCQAITVYLDGSGNATISGNDLDGGSTDNCSVASNSASITAFTCNDIGANTVTLTTTDGSGNSSNCAATVTIADSSSPNAQCQPVTIYLDGSGNASITANDLDGGSSDNCSVASLSAGTTSFTCNDVGTNSVTLTVTDGEANTSTCSSTVTVVDSTAPTATCQSVVVYLDGSGNASLSGGDIDGGSSDNCAINSLTAGTTSFTCNDIGTNTVTLTAADASGNTSTCSAAVTIADSSSPTALCANPTIYLDGSGNATISGTDIDGGSSDNCSVGSLSAGTTSFTCNDIGTNTVVLTVTDGQSNTSSCSSTVTIADSTSPTALCTPVSIILDGSGNATITANDIDGGSSDNCTVSSVSAGTTAFTCNDVGANTVTLTVTDGQSNVSTCNATVTVVDTTSPTAVCQSATFYLNSSGTASLSGNDIDGGSTDNCSVASLTPGTTSLTCNDLGTNNFTLTVADPSANTSTCQAAITVLDTTRPSAICNNVNVVLDGSGNATITANDIDGGSTDNCTISSLSAATTSFNCNNTGANFVILTVTDSEGNVNFCTATVTVSDTTAPSAVCQNPTIYLDGSGNATITGNDIDGGSSDNCAITNYVATITSFDCNDIGTNTVSLFVSDNSANFSSCTAIVTIADSTAPTVSCLNPTVYLDGSGNASITVNDVSGGATDNCSTPTLSLSSSTFDCNDIGTATVTLSATDGEGNTGTCVASVTVNDTVAPTAICQNITIYLDSIGQASITGNDLDGGSTDNCGITSLVAGTPNFNCLTLGTNTVVLSAIDGEGNIGSCNATVTAVDTIGPVAACSDLTVYLGPSGMGSVTAQAVAGSSYDNCQIDSIAVDSLNFDCSEIGPNTVNAQLFDNAGNSSNCSVTVTVADTLPPMVLCKNDTVYLGQTGSASITPINVDGGSGDNCGILSRSVTPNTFSGQNIGPNTVVLVIEDINGNIDSCDATVTVLDTLGTSAEPIIEVAQLEFTAYPNPTDGTLFVTVSCPGCIPGEEGEVFLTDMTGRILGRRSADLRAGEFKTEFQLSNYANGNYFVTLRMKNGAFQTRKVVKY